MRNSRPCGGWFLAADRILGTAELLRRLHTEQLGAWSAGTIVLPDGRIVVVYNPIVYDSGAMLTPQQAQHDGRTRSDVGHELAHLVLGHDLREVQRIGERSFFTCDPEQEQQATWLAGAPLLPRPLLLRELRRDTSESDIAARYEVTPQMIPFRLNTTGARMQIVRERGRPSRTR